MKKIAIFALLLAACATAARAQESRQDFSISGNVLIEPFISSSTTVQVSANRAFGALASYRFMLTPTSALEANYGFSYQNSVHIVKNPNNYLVSTRGPANLRRLCPLLCLQEFQPLRRSGSGSLHLPARSKHGDQDL
jgi:hypothetical protein